MNPDPSPFSWLCKPTIGTSGKSALKCPTSLCPLERSTLGSLPSRVMFLMLTSKFRNTKSNATECSYQTSSVHSIVSVTTNQIYTNKTYGAPPVNAARPTASQPSKQSSSAGFSSWFLFFLKVTGLVLFCVFAFSAWVSKRSYAMKQDCFNLNLYWLFSSEHTTRRRGASDSERNGLHV